MKKTWLEIVAAMEQERREYWAAFEEAVHTLGAFLPLDVCKPGAVLYWKGRRYEDPAHKIHRHS